MKNTKSIIKQAPYHTIKKIELVTAYVESWAYKVISLGDLVFIDCMANCGEYVDSYGKKRFGTPVLVAEKLSKIARAHPDKKVDLYFSDLSEDKTSHLRKLLPSNTANFRTHVVTGDGNELAKKIGKEKRPSTSYLLFYDPYEADIDWDAITPFINGWSELILNHMVSDPLRGIQAAKRPAAKQKYEKTYLAAFEDLVPFGSDKKAYEKRIQKIITECHSKSRRNLFVAAFPFFNSNNTMVYDLVHCTGNRTGFRLFKEKAWKTFGGKSSLKNSHGVEGQIVLDLDNKGYETTATDEDCYHIKDIAEYLRGIFDGRTNVPWDEVWAVLDEHPLFPSDGFRNEIKEELKNHYGATVSRKAVSFPNKRGSNEDN